MSAPTTTRDVEAIRRACTRSLMHHGLRTPRQVLAELAELADPDLTNDTYGQGGPITPFEAEIATLLGKEAALFLPSGTMAQQVALRSWADRRGARGVAMHPRNHLDAMEKYAYQHLHGLHGVQIGDPDRLLTPDDLKGIAVPLAALLLELPQREIGGQLSSWDDLVAITGWARERGIPVHMDGARLWDAAPFYERPLTEITALFDSVYVSFYKALGGIAGAALAGPADLIAEARVWQKRHGGTLVQMYPYILSARHGLRTRLDRMGDYWAKAVEVAAALSAIPGVKIVPNPPQTRMFHLYLPAEIGRLRNAALDLAAETGTWSFDRPGITPLPGYAKIEFSAGDATLDVPTDEIAGIFREILARANA
ncbi:MAG: beta-eliminating lyase-related protein [Chloroflexia bacterium]